MFGYTLDILFIIKYITKLYVIFYSIIFIHLQTFCLSEALEFAVGCVQSLQSRIAIKLEPINNKICQYCITDKQVQYI